jgi:hypothetical protein
MGAAFGWGTLAGSSLVIGALIALRFDLILRAIGMIMGFGTGVLISAVSFDLIEEARSAGSSTCEALGGSRCRSAGGSSDPSATHSARRLRRGNDSLTHSG